MSEKSERFILPRKFCKCGIYTTSEKSELRRICSRRIRRVDVVRYPIKKQKKTVRIKWNCELKNRKSRCGMCKKKIKLTLFDCKCDKVFCLRHKAREDHDCTFDYLEKGNEELSEEIPLVFAEKVRHI